MEDWDLKEEELGHPFFSYMYNFRHLMCPHPFYLFEAPPISEVKKAQNRIVYDYFISYRHKISAKYAQTIFDELTACGYRVYFAGQTPELSLYNEDELREKLYLELHKASVFVIIGNKNMFEGEWVTWEMESFYEGHFGRKVPIITEGMGSPLDNDGSLESLALKSIRLMDTSAAIIYEEDDIAWESQKPSATTIFCLILVKEFYRVELEFWHNWLPIYAKAGLRLYFESLYKDMVCRITMRHMLMLDRDNALKHTKIWLLKRSKRRNKDWTNTFGFKGLLKSIQNRIQNLIGAKLSKV